MSQKTYDSYREEFFDFTKEERIEHLKTLRRELDDWPDSTPMLSIQIDNMSNGFSDIVISPEIDDPNYVMFALTAELIPTYFVSREEYNDLTVGKLKKEIDAYFRKHEL